MLQIVIYHHTGDEMFFSTNGGGEADRDLTISSLGNVGIGTSSPAQKLHTTSGVARTSTAKTETAFFASDDSDDYRFGLAISHKGGTTDSDRYASIDSTAYRISTDAFAAGGALVLQQLGGNVGIGIDTPDAKLRIDQDVGTVGLKVTGGSGGTNIAEFIRDVGATTTVGINGSGAEPQMYFTSTANTFAIGC